MLDSKISIEDILTVEHKNFDSWESSARYVVSTIFNFEKDLGFLPLENVIEKITKVISGNSFYFSRSFENIEDEVDLCKKVIDYFVNTNLYQLDRVYLIKDKESKTVKDFIQIVQSLFHILSHCSISLSEKLKFDSKYTDQYQISLTEENISKIVIGKQYDYGSNNVSKFGLNGLIIRMHDKVARLENLLNKSKDKKLKVSNESIFDTLIDIIGYSTISIMWIYEYFKLPLEIENNT